MSNTADYNERHPYDWPFSEAGKPPPRRRVTSITVVPPGESSVKLPGIASWSRVVGTLSCGHTAGLRRRDQQTVGCRECLAHNGSSGAGP